MLSFENVTKEFQLDAQNVITPVRDMSLEIAPGELIIILGRSGTGKTTLLNLAAGMVRPTRGKVSIEDKDLAALNDRELSALRTRKLGFMFQFPSLLPALNIQDNVSLPAIFTDDSGDSAGQRALELLDMLGLSGKASVYPRQLSAGEQKRAVIARALLNQPAIVLADEPTSDLDEHTESEVMEHLVGINRRGVTFLIVTHNRELKKFASRAFEMDHGSLSQIR
jgi:ABC-type lipoprotein export system ATPase subunit